MILYGYLDIYKAFKLETVQVLINDVLYLKNKIFRSKIDFSQENASLKLQVLTPREYITNTIVEILSSNFPFGKIKSFKYIEQNTQALFMQEINISIENFQSIINHPRIQINYPVLNVLSGTVRTAGSNTEIVVYQKIDKLIDQGIILDRAGEFYLIEVDNKKLNKFWLSSIFKFENFNITTNTVSGTTIYNANGTTFSINLQSKYILLYNILNRQLLKNISFANIIEYWINDIFTITNDNSEIYGIDLAINNSLLNGNIQVNITLQ